MDNLIIRNKETKEYVKVENKYGYSSFDFETAFLYVSRLPVEDRAKIEIFDLDEENVIEPKHYISNDRFLLFLDKEKISLKDYAMGKIDKNLNVPYMAFIDDMVKEFENGVKTVLANQDEFTDYLKYKVLGDIAYNEAYTTAGVGLIHSSPKMNSLLNKYNISEETDKILYQRISDRFNKGNQDKIKENFEKEVLAKIPEKYKEKYIESLDFNNKRSTLDNYIEFSESKVIAENIEEIESLKAKVKFFVYWSENSIFNENSVLTYEEMNSKTDRAILKVEERNQRESEEAGTTIHTYDKTKFSIIIDDGNEFEITSPLRHDIGDYSSFKNYMKDNLNSEFLDKISRLKDDREKENDNLPELLFSKGDVNLIKYKTGDNAFYSVDIENKSIGMTLYMDKNIEKVKRIFDKEILFNVTQKQEDDKLYKIFGLNSIYGSEFSKSLIFDDKILGRRCDLVNYFRNELDHCNEYYPDEENKRDKEIFIERTKELIDELSDLSKPSLEPVAIELDSMNKTFNVASEDVQLEMFKNTYEELEKNTDLSKTDEEEDER